MAGMRMTGMELRNATHGVWFGTEPALIKRLCSDSRLLNPEDLFLAIRGPNFDGHLFAAEAMNRGAVGIIGDEKGLLPWRALAVPMLQVSDTLQALGDIAAAWRKKIRARVVAISGSFGKTTVRSMLEHCLVGMGLSVWSTRLNENNLIGVPQTLLGARGDEDIILLECGVSEAGEMDRLARIVQADVCIISGISMAHAAGLGGLTGVIHEKAKLLHSTSGWCALGEKVATALKSCHEMPAIPCLDMDADAADAVRWQLHGRTLRLSHADDNAALELALPAPHWAADMSLALSVVLQLIPGSNLTTLAPALQTWRAVCGRMQSHPGPGGSIIIDDAYNANPSSMAAALNTLRQLEGRHFAILGDMEELGSESDRLHAGLNVAGLDGLILVGDRMQCLHARSPSQSIWVRSAEEVFDLVGEWHLAENEHVLIKASRSIGLDTLVRQLTELADAL